MSPIGGSQCPRCQTELLPVSTGSVVLRACEKCLGLWADVGSFQQLCVDKRPSELPSSASVRPRRHHDLNEPVRYWPCPVCGDFMSRVNFAGHSGIILDVCRAHGVWLDNEELDQVRQFIQRGGVGGARLPSPPCGKGGSWPTAGTPVACGPGEVADLILFVSDILRLLH